MSWSYAFKDEVFFVDSRDEDIAISYDFTEKGSHNKIIAFNENPLIKFINSETTSLDIEHYKILEKLDE